jgi:hypothetical protein
MDSFGVVAAAIVANPEQSWGARIAGATLLGVVWCTMKKIISLINQKFALTNASEVQSEAGPNIARCGRPCAILRLDDLPAAAETGAASSDRDRAIDGASTTTAIE